VEGSCELGNEPLGSIKCWELRSGCTTCGLSSGTQLHRVSSLDHRCDRPGRYGEVKILKPIGTRDPTPRSSGYCGSKGYFGLCPRG
jgi:hypothetical protein